MTPPSAAKVLLRAADLIGQDGWCQGQLRDDEGRRDLVGAVQAAVAGLGGSVLGNAYADALLAAKDQVGPRWQLTDWNDAAGRTVGEVVRVLCSAAAVCETWAAA